MEILKNGNLERVRRTKYFRSPYCDAIWSATRQEYKYNCQYNKEGYYCKCPTKDCNSNGSEITETEALRDKEI